MNTLTKAQKETLAYIVIADTTKGVHVNTRVNLRFDYFDDVLVNGRYTNVLTEAGKEAVKDSEIFKVFQYLQSKGFEFLPSNGTKKSFIKFINPETKQQAYISGNKKGRCLYMQVQGFHYELTNYS